MKIVNEKFIESLKGARNISAILTYNSNKSYRILTNEASENITTELNELLATEKGSYEVKDNQLLRINPSFNASLFKTICKSLEIETTENIAANEKINIKIGVKVDEDYQFLNFGNYIVKDSTYQADTDTYLLVAYDKMMESMIKYDDNPLSITYPIEHKNLIIAICEKLNWSYEINDYLNSNAVIDKDLYSGQNLTYRDILDDLLTAVGENLLFDLNDKLVNKKVENSFLSDNIMDGNSLYLKEALESNALEYSIDGKCEQDGTPTPDSPVEIKTIKGIRNLLNLNALTSTTNGITCTNNNDGSITINGHTTAGFAYYLTNDNITFEKGKKYTISAKILSGSCTNYTSSTSWAFEFIADKNNSNATLTYIGSTTKEVKKTFDGTNSSAKPYLWFGWNSSTTENDAVFNDLRVQFMVEESDTKHSFVPYGTYEKIRITGKNVLKIKNGDRTANGITSVFDNTKVKLNGITTTTYANVSNRTYNEIQSGNYIFSINRKLPFLVAYRFVYEDGSYTDARISAGDTSVTVVFLNKIVNYYMYIGGFTAGLEINEEFTLQLEKGTEVTDYEPYKEKEVLIDLAKENLFDKDNANELNAWINATNGLLTTNTSTNSVIVGVEKNTDYTISRLASDKFRIGFYNSIPTGGETLVNYKSNDTGDIITANSGDNTYLIIYYYDNNSGSYTKQEILNSLKVYKGTNADDSYELNSINDTKDKLEIKNGVVVIQKRIKKIVLNGTENWYKAEKGYLIQNNNNLFANNNSPFGYCDKFKFQNSYTTWTKQYYCGFNSTNTFWIRDDFAIAATVEEFKSWLKANPVTVYYELREPEIITLPNTNIPLYEDINHVTLVEDLETNTSIIYKKPFIIDDELLKDVNVDFKEKYGPVNSLTISSNNTVINSLEDKKSIEKNGKITFNINDNYLLNYNSDAFINQLFNKIYNLEYYTYDFDSTGILVLEALDRFIVNHNNNNYNCLMLNDDIKLTTGLIETTYAEKPEENEDNYYSVSPQEKKINNALISIDKANAEIVLKVDSNGKIAQARLDGNADKGSKFTIKADNIELEGYSTVNEGFIVTTEGNAQVHSSLFDVTNAKKLTNPAVITVRNYNKGQAKGEYYADQIILSNNDGTDIFTVGDGNIGDYHGGVLTVGNDEIDSSITMYDGIINCVEVNQSSLESIKKNFEKLENGLSIVENAEIYKYNLKKENDDDKKHIGLVIGNSYNTPYEVISKNGNSIEIYSMISVAWQCIKELNDKINNLEKEISKLKGESK